MAAKGNQNIRFNPEKSMKALVPGKDNEQYNTCVFGQHKLRNQCTALNNVYCCIEECKFYKSSKEYAMDRSTCFVRKRTEEEMAAMTEAQ